MIFAWLAFAVMTLATATILALPLFFTRKVKNEAVFALAVYRDQLQELNRDAVAGLIAPEQAKSAQVEIERRILALTMSPQWQPGRAPSHGLLMTGAVVLPLLGFGLYLLLGAPALPGEPFAARETATVAVTPELARLEADVAARPTTAAAWSALAAGYDAAGRSGNAATAYGKAVALGARDATTFAAYGQALLAAEQGHMSEAAAAAFQRALAVDPGNPTARFFLALGKAQQGDVEGALTDWLAQEKDTPADAPWRQTLEDHIARAAHTLGRELPADIVPGAKTGSIAAGETTATDAMSPEDRTAFINGMVARLEEKLKAEPGDLEGWVRLARAFRVLSRTDEARSAWAKAAALAPAQLDIQLDYANAIIAGRTDLERYLPPEFVETVGRVRTLDPNHPLGLYYGGLVARLAGDTAEARRMWNLVLDRLPAGAPQRDELKRALDSLQP